MRSLEVVGSNDPAMYTTDSDGTQLVTESSGGVRVYQLMAEIIPCLTLAELYIKSNSTDGIRTVVEIGSAEWGNSVLLSKIVDPGGAVVSIEPCLDWPEDYMHECLEKVRCMMSPVRLIHLRGLSTDDDMFDRVMEATDGRGADFLFIDAEHDEESAKHDYITYYDCVRHPGVIAFHDICSDSHLDVSRVRGHRTIASYWNDVVKKGEYYAEIVHSTHHNRFGIGMLFV